jgi:hypothetical protein
VRILAQDEEIVSLWTQIQGLETEAAMPDFSPYKEGSGKIGDIRPGYTVWAQAGENIRDKTEFTAVKVIASENLPASAGMPAVPAAPANTGGLNASPYNSR